MKKRVGLIMLSIMPLLLIVYSVSAFWPFDKNVQLQPDPTTDVQLQVGNAAPIVSITSVDDNLIVQDNIVDLQAGAAQTVRIIFDVEDPNGPPGTNLDESTLAITYGFPSGGPFTEQRTGTIADCTSVDNANIRTYTCDIDMQYYDSSGSWDAVVDIDDTASIPLTGTDTLIYTVSSLLDISITTPINFGTVAAGQQDVTGISTTVTNNGNFVVPTDGNIQILSGALGTSPPGDTISSTNFNARGSSGVGDVCLTGPSDGTSLVDGFSATNIGNVALPKGTTGNNEETLSYCLDVPNVAEESYSALNGDGVWTIQIA